MAELLIKAFDNTHPDPVKDRVLYKRGDIVQVFEDGACTEPPAPGSKMMIVKVPGPKAADFADYVREEVSAIEPDITLTRRLWRLRIELLPDVVPDRARQALEDDGVATFTAAHVLAALENKATGELAG